MNQDVRVSEIQIVPIKPHEGLIAFASFVLDGRYYIGSVAIFTKIDGSGYRLVYPTKKIGIQNINIFHPINFDTGNAIERFVIEKVNEVFNENFYGSNR